MDPSMSGDPLPVIERDLALAREIHGYADRLNLAQGGSATGEPHVIRIRQTADFIARMANRAKRRIVDAEPEAPTS